MNNAMTVENVSGEVKQALLFLKTLDPKAKADDFHFRTFDDVEIEIDGNFEKRLDGRLAKKYDGGLKANYETLREFNSNGAGVFVVVNQGGQSKDEINKVRAVFADTDGAPLEPLLILKPHMVIQSSPNKWHVYWLVDDEFSIESFKPIQKAIAYKFGTDSSINDLPRVMRLAGFNHNKSTPFPVCIIKLSADLPRYSSNEIIEGLGLDLEADIKAKKQLPSVAKLGNYLGTNSIKNTEPYLFTNENAVRFLSAAKIAYPNILDEGEFTEWGFTCVNLIALDGWLEIEAKRTFDAVCHLATNAKTDDNDEKWESYKRQSLSYASKPRRVASVFEKARENGWVDTAITDALAAVQDKFALISLGGKVGIIDKQCLETTNIDGTAARLVVMSRMDGGLLVQRYLSSEYPQVDSKGTLSTFTHSKNTTLYSGVEFNPRSTSPNTLNLWVGATVIPKQGKCPLIHTLLLEVLCGGRQSEYQYLIKYLAHALQRPWEKPGVMVVLLGGQGIGKGTLAKILQKMWSATFLQTNRIKQVVGDFNGSLERAYIVFLDEALFVGDRNSSDALKSLVTEPTISINEKHQPTRQIKSYHRFISATNSDHFKATDRDDRRDFVLRVSEHRKGDYAFWDALNAEIENGSVEAFTHELLAIDLTGFNVRAKPNTRELTEQKLQSLDKFPRWWFDCLSQGAIFPRSDNGWPSFISSATLLSKFTEADKAVRSYKQIIDRDIVSFMSKVCPSAKREQGMEGIHRKRGYALPTLEHAREDFEKFIGDKIEWEDL
jgi:hypothetical protein